MGQSPFGWDYVDHIEQIYEHSILMGRKSHLSQHFSKSYGAAKYLEHLIHLRNMLALFEFCIFGTKVIRNFSLVEKHQKFQ